jgi:hypothetical protein
MSESQSRHKALHEMKVIPIIDTVFLQYYRMMNRQREEKAQTIIEWPILSLRDNPMLPLNSQEERPPIKSENRMSLRTLEGECLSSPTSEHQQMINPQLQLTALNESKATEFLTSEWHTNKTTSNLLFHLEM